MQTSLETAGNGHAAEIPADAFPKVRDINIDPAVEVNGAVFTTMHLREPTFQEVTQAETVIIRDAFGRMTDASSRLYQATLISKVSGVSRAAIDKMRISQVNEAFSFLMEFRDAGPATGET